MRAALIGTPERWVRSSAMVRVFTGSTAPPPVPPSGDALALFLALPGDFPRFLLPLFALAAGAGARGTTRSIV